MAKYIGGFADDESVLSAFEAPKDALDGAVVLVAWYGSGSYCGSAYVLFVKDGKLWEVEGSHCSCCGLEDQWAPSEVTWKALSMRNYKEPYGDYEEETACYAAMRELIAAHMEVVL